MAKKTAAPKWVEFRLGPGQHVLLGPAETVVKWRGTEGTGPYRLYFTYWKDLVSELPEHVRPAPLGPQHTLELASEAAVKSTIKELTAWLQQRDPAAKAKKQKTTTVFTYEGSHVIVDAMSITRADVVLAEIEDREVGTLDVDGSPLVQWKVSTWATRVRATADEIVFVDAEQAPPLDATFAGGTPLGSWTFRELLVASWLKASITDYKGVASADAGALAAVAGKPLKPTFNEHQGGALVVAASGTFRAETGSTGGVRWCRFVRE
jgi:hypothetical protein